MIAQPVRSTTEETRERILSAARQLFATQGPRGTTTREVAELAGVNEATLFRHFGNKNALLEAMKEHFCINKEAHLRELYSSLQGDLRADLLTIGNAMMEGMTANIDLIRVALLESAVDPDTEQPPFRMPRVSRDYLANYLQTFIGKGELRGDAGVLARMFMGMFFAYVVGQQFWMHSPEAAILSDPHKAVECFVDIFLDGARIKA